MKKLTTGDQEKLGKHRLGGIAYDEGHIKHVEKNEQDLNKYKELVDSVVENALKSKDIYDKTLIPTGFTIIVKPYKSNPYVPKIEKLDSGLIYAPSIGLDGIYKSHETGEVEMSDQIPCGEIIAVGPECKYCEVGDDIYYRPGAVPVPVYNLGYWAISEQNVICRITNKNK